MAPAIRNASEPYLPEVQDVGTWGYGPRDAVWPITLLHAALSFARVADAAVISLGPVSAASADGLTVLLLLAQSMELSLKAFLLKTLAQPKGYEEKGKEGLTKKIGHSLPKALSAAVAIGFPPPHPSDEKLLQVLDTTYAAGRRLQYRVPGALRVPPLRPVRELAQLYLQEVHRWGHCGIADPRRVPGLGIDPAADYGVPSLEQFRIGAENLSDLRDLRE